MGATVEDCATTSGRRFCFKLRSEIDVRVIQQKTSTIKEDILLAAEGAKVNQNEFQTMLIIAKHINSNDAQRSINFHSFDRAKACKYE